MNPKNSIFDSSEYVEVKQIKNCKKVGDHYVIQNIQTSEIYLRKTIITSSLKNAEKLYNKFSNRVQNLSENLINCQDFSLTIKRDFCSKFFIFRVFYEYPLNDLEILLKEKIKKNNFLPHEKLTQIFYNILESLNFLELNSIGHGHLQIFNIFFSSKNNIFKILDNFSSLKFRDIYLNYIYTNKGFFVFAPETLASIQSGSDEFINYSKIDVFHLGLILLILGNLSPVNKLYDLNNFIIRKEKLEELLKGFEKRYGGNNPLLVKIVKKLVVLNCNDRMLPSEIKKSFPSYKEFKGALSRNGSRSNLDFFDGNDKNAKNHFDYKGKKIDYGNNGNGIVFSQNNKNGFGQNINGYGQQNNIGFQQNNNNVKHYNQNKKNLGYHNNEKKTSKFQIFPDKKDKNFFDF